MRIDATKSKYQEGSQASKEFSATELRKLRLLLRRLRFLETMLIKHGGLANGGESGASALAEWEAEALAWALYEIGFLGDYLQVNGDEE